MYKKLERRKKIIVWGNCRASMGKVWRKFRIKENSIMRMMTDKETGKDRK
jgi:hypothetical protein